MKHIMLFFTLIFLPLRLLATECIPDCQMETDWTLEVRGAYYDLSSKAIEKIYTNSWLDYQVEGAKRVHRLWEVWGGICWASKHGHTRRTYGSCDYKFKDSTKMFILPVSLGLKFIYPILPFIDIYAGVGVCYSFLKIKNFCKEEYSYWGLHRSPFKKNIYKSRLGGVFKLGFQYALSDSTFFDVFADYYLQHFHFSHKKGKSNRNIFNHDLDCSGFKFGAGFGVYF